MTRTQRPVLFGLFLPLLFLSTAQAGPLWGQASARRQTRQITRASWYGKRFKGQPTASGVPFNPQGLTAAHRTLDLGTRVKVTELQSGRSVVVEITDRGPFLPGRGIDLSYGAARALGIVQRGIARVELELLDQEPTAEAPIVTASRWPVTPWLPKAIVQ